MVVIVDYGLGNLRSVAGAVAKLGYSHLILNKQEDIEKGEKIILPGVGAFKDAISNLNNLGLADALTDSVIGKKKPILGICLGSQLMAKESFEFGRHKGLGWIDASVLKLESEGLRIPHVGWNNLTQLKRNILFEGIPDEALFYYVHSFYVRCNNPDIVIGECEYGRRFACAFNQGNIYATQFHPEKSQSWGMKLLSNFLSKA